MAAAAAPCVALRLWLFVLLALVLLLSACDMVTGMAESRAHAAPIEAEIAGAVGTKPDVFSAGSGTLLVVTVLFSEVPYQPVPALEAVARAAIVHEFKQEPTMLTISFVYHTPAER